ncbi:MAG TPA: hypothetical protein VNM40_01690 [Candidatus Paceibacterota bacterium]|nr:hypothetical protein [Candidatus Paceibacterota bacterium]
MGDVKDAFSYADDYLRKFVEKVDAHIVDLEKRIKELESKVK